MASGLPATAISMTSHRQPKTITSVGIPRSALDEKPSKPLSNPTAMIPAASISTNTIDPSTNMVPSGSASSGSTLSTNSGGSENTMNDMELPISGLANMKVKPKSKSVSFIRNSKRSNSTSNDSLYERDRFRARLHNFNIESEQIEEDECDVCDIIGSKTTKLNFAKDEDNPIVSPLTKGTGFHNRLQSVNLNSYGVSVKQLSLDDVEFMFNWYFNQPLPHTSEMFPWLHGLHLDNLAQLQFFVHQKFNDGIDQSKLLDINFKPLTTRFLMSVNADLEDPDDTHFLKNNTTLKEILCPIETSRAEVKKSVTEIVADVFPNSIFKEELANRFAKDVFDVKFLPIFLNLDPPSGISLRNFQIQVAKSAVCSDFIVYCFKEKNLDYCKSVASVIWLAQKYEDVLNPLGGNTYDTFMMTHFDTVLKTDRLFGNNIIPKDLYKLDDINRLVKLKLEFLQNWDNEYVLKEKIETIKMSSASKLCGSLFSGNSWDYQNFLNFKYSNKKHFLSNKRMMSFSTLYCNPLNSITTSNFNPTDLIETVLPLPNMNYRFFVNCFKEASFPDTPSLDNLLKVFSSYNKSNTHHKVGDYYCLNFPSSGSIGIGDIKLENIISILNTCKLIHLISNVKGLDSLICCSDGYTESSLLILSYIIYSQNCDLNDAIVTLHLKFGRPFYIFNTDVQILQKLEPIIREYSPAKSKQPVDWSNFETVSDDEINQLLLSPKSFQGYRLNYNNSHTTKRLDEDCCSSSSSSSSSDSSFEDSIINYKPDWCKEVEGSLPSRILPYLYLGSLKHANCVPLLKELGITKIISVGEPLHWINGRKFQKENDITVEELNGGDIEIYNIQTLGRYSSKPCVDQIMKVNNLQDDGIAQLESSLPSILEFIEQAYQASQGQTKILIHCRVGVSRSATVAIAEVMKRLNLNLAKAYMYVRVRRLNIIIQPNLKFMYELFRWQESHKPKEQEYLREIDWFAMCREITSLNQPYLSK